MLRPVYTVKNIDTLNQLYHSYYRKFLVGLEYLFFRSGAMTMGPSQLCGFTKSNPSLETPDLQFHLRNLQPFHKQIEDHLGQAIHALLSKH